MSFQIFGLFQFFFSIGRFSFLLSFFQFDSFLALIFFSFVIPPLNAFAVRCNTVHVAALASDPLFS